MKIKAPFTIRKAYKGKKQGGCYKHYLSNTRYTVAKLWIPVQGSRADIRMEFGVSALRRLVRELYLEWLDRTKYRACVSGN